MVLAEGGISTERKPLRSIHRQRELHTSTIGVLDIAREQLARIGQLACLHKLVTIHHIVEIYAQRHHLCIIGIARFDVEHLLGSRVLTLADIGEVVACRLLLTHRCRCIYGVRLQERVVQTELRIEEVVVAVDVESLHSTCSVVEVVIHARNAVCDVAILHIGIEV